MLSRRSHTKSRRGCSECKRRKVKCDEQKPICTQCARRQLHCQYGPGVEIGRRNGSSPPLRSTQCPSCHRPMVDDARTPQDVSGTQSHLETSPRSDNRDSLSTDLAQGRLQDNQASNAKSNEYTKLDKLDLEIFYTLLISLPPEMKSTPERNSPQFWIEVLPRLVFEHDFILHLALALAAQFMVRHQKVTSQDVILARASEHYQLALPSFIDRLANVRDVQNLWVGSLLMCLHYFACGPKTGDYLLFSDIGDPEWNTLFRGARKLWELSSSSMQDGDRPTPSSYDTSPLPVVEGSDEANTTSSNDRGSFFIWLRRFHDLLTTLTVEDPSYGIYIQALENLELSYVEQYGAPEGSDKSVRVVTHSTFAWLYRVSDEFIAALQAKKSIALVIFTFYVPLLYDGQPRWLITDWSHHILSGIEKHLHPHYLRWIQWVFQYTKYVVTEASL